MTLVWRLLPAISAPMPLQMALDEILFRDRIEKTSSEFPIIRFYFSSEPWTTVGFSDSVRPGRGDKICRRITGGGRVQHGRDLVFSLVARREDDSSFRSVALSYGRIHEVVQAGYAALGKKPSFYEKDEHLPRGGDCFLHPIATDLKLEGRKVAGGAQKRSSGVLLHQESLEPAGLDPLELVGALCAAFAETFQVRILKETLDPALLERARDLAGQKYHPETLLQGDEGRAIFAASGTTA